MRRPSLLAVLIMISGTVAHAGDLDTLGPVYPIGERHLLDLIAARLHEKDKTGELARLARDARERGVASVMHPAPLAGIGPSAAARTFYYDPSLVLDHNIVDADGRLLFAAGTRKNPLDIVSLSKHLLFFDARDARQVARARALIDLYHGRVKPILVGGSYLELMKTWQIPVYYDQEGRLTQRLRITHVPAIVSQEGLRLRIDELVL